ncbi:hypothetical protein BLNAU_22862 [Blattamonas nauphoetae]|uniref:Uncharacterized protein n=1 Tax=Blattamonas nauphoetae TaxID=2049346 RepID=A0ABQ9WRT7_9EUKA|nr:hypothetical protein BLNAU_22862 [Blattamonas nauphoetae]
MNSILVVVQIFLSAQHPPHPASSIFTSHANSFQKSQNNEESLRPREIHLDDDLVISSTIQIRSEGISLKGDDTTLMFPPLREVHSESLPSSQVDHRTRIDAATPRKRNMRSGTTSNFMFDVWNSTFSASGVHVICNSGDDGFCLVSSSIVHFSFSSITSNGISSPFMIEMSDWTNGEQRWRLFSHRSLTTRRLTSCLPLSGFLHPSTSLPTECHKTVISVPPNAEHRISIFGTGLLFESGSISSGTGPLFSFGLTDHDSSLSALRNDVEMETSLSSSSFVNMTSTHCCLSTGQLSNHNSGTGMLDANVGGNVVCVNSSFSHCIRQPNEAKDFANENITQSVVGRLSSVASSVTSVSYTLCTFDTMTVAVGVNYQGGAAIFLFSASSSLTVEQCFFHQCSCTGNADDEGAICVTYQASLKLPVSISDSSFTECTTLGEELPDHHLQLCFRVVYIDPTRRGIRDFWHDLPD